MDDYSWDLDPKDSMIIVIKNNGVRVMSLFVGEAMESIGRRKIMRHVKECDNSPWIHKWHIDGEEDVINILKGEDG